MDVSVQVNPGKSQGEKEVLWIRGRRTMESRSEKTSEFEGTLTRISASSLKLSRCVSPIGLNSKVELS